MANLILSNEDLKSLPSGLKVEKNAGLIMATNNSSIVSKRSVERLYYPKPHFFQYFVRKPQRRSPTINRGYWLRMQAIDSVVKEFLQRPSEKQKVVINLGCGYDPLPFQWLSRELDLCRNVRFVDVDYKELMITKATIVRETPVFKELVKLRWVSHHSFVIESGQYNGIGCDLRDLRSLDLAVGSLGGIDEALVLCVAEVSVTYMDPDAADALISWAKTLSNGKSDVTFALLEQFLPDGPEHPFAKTMLRHFDKLHTPLRSIHKYPSLRSQTQRFHNAGWKAVRIANLWQLWSDPDFLTTSQRLSLDQVEPFDEWEEFALFAAHYFLLIARTKTGLGQQQHAAEGEGEASTSAKTPSTPDFAKIAYGLRYIENPKSQGLRRHGAILRLPDEPGCVDSAVAYHGGVTYEGRAPTSDYYSLSKVEAKTSGVPPLRIAARLCHTITGLSNGYSVLVGGRTSPAAAMKDCYRQTETGWNSIQDLPKPRYRHSAAAIVLPDSVPGLLVFGGKSASDQVLDNTILWNEASGWMPLQNLGHSPQPRFGATFVALSDDSGVLSGGLRPDGVVLQDLWRWTLVLREDRPIGLTFLPVGLEIDPAAEICFGRFGASQSFANNQLLLIGGIAASGCIASGYETLALDVTSFGRADQENKPSLQVSGIDLRREPNIPRPMFIGHDTLHCADTGTLIAGGGAICFSFGTHGNSGLYILYQLTGSARLDWSFKDSNTALETEKVSSSALNGLQGETAESSPVERVALRSTPGFLNIVKQSQPKILKELDFGPCRTLWTKDYLSSKIRADRSVVVHEAHSRSMNFQRKDFAYKTKPFGAFLDEIYEGGHQYLRSISCSDPTKRAANLESDFPEIAGDFRLPPELRSVTDSYHSSPLRITGDVAMWLHVDTMANVLCQVEGSKRLILFPPADMVKLDFPPGSTTSNVEIFQAGDPNGVLSIPGTHPFEAIVQAGDVLFIPPLWAHTAAPLQKVSVAVNVFFRNLSKGYAAGKDVYGNRDLEAYENGRRDVNKIAKAFEDVPPDLAQAYLLRLADELRSKAVQYGPTL